MPVGEKGVEERTKETKMEREQRSNKREREVIEGLQSCTNQLIIISVIIVDILN